MGKQVLKILQVHNYYQYSGGEDQVVEEEKKLLESHQHQVIQFTKNNSSINGFFKKIQLLFSTHYSRKSKKEFNQTLSKYNPDIVHVHNFFPLITPSIYDACIENNIPVIQTLHNYRLIHPNGYLFYNGKIDERSLNGSAYKCVREGIYRNSRIQTAVVAHMIEYHRRNKTWHNKVDQFIALSEFARNKFIEGGLPHDKIIVKSNFIEDYGLQYQNHHGVKDNSYVYLGRISDEKGIIGLVNAWISKSHSNILYIFGKGPYESELKNLSKNYKNVKWMGFANKEVYLKYLAKANALIFPSICYENFPISILEAFSIGVPVISSDMGSHGSIVQPNFNGLHFNASQPSEILEKVEYLSLNNEIQKDLGRQARDTFLNNYTPDKNYEQLREIYSSICRIK